MGYVKSLPCRVCSAPVYREKPNGIIPFLCESCAAKRKAEVEADHAARVKIGEDAQMAKKHAAFLFDEHRVSGHLDKNREPMYVKDCEPCAASRAINTETLWPIEDIPRALK